MARKTQRKRRPSKRKRTCWCYEIRHGGRLVAIDCAPSKRTVINMRRHVRKAYWRAGRKAGISRIRRTPGAC